MDFDRALYVIQLVYGRSLVFGKALPLAFECGDFLIQTRLFQQVCIS
jgi:hypothetical protein